PRPKPATMPKPRLNPWPPEPKPNGLRKTRRGSFDATGEQAGRLEELATSGRRIKGDRLRDLANGTQQVIWGEFQAYADASATVPVFMVPAIDSSFYEVATNDPRVLQNLRATFRDVRPA
ncbi:hypothetical protein, partial [Methylobacterium marchantiae]